MDEIIPFKNLAFSGPSGAGKTTLVGRISEISGVKHKPDLVCVKSVAHEVFSRYGFSQGDQFSARVRLFLQNKILEKQVDQYQAIRDCELMISDRTPMDMAAYMMSDPLIHREGIYTDTRAYAAVCAQVTKHYFPNVVLVPFCIPYEESDKRPPFNELRLNRYYGVLRGLLIAFQVPFLEMPKIDGVDRRIEWLKSKGM